jgi:ElaB/YqjD/DUF883 family membrane-anchored ribosome-binding protein
MVAFDANRHSIQEERDHINLSPNPEWYNGAFLSKEEGEAVFAVAKEKLTEFLKSSETEFKKIKTKQEQELNEFEEKQEQELNELKTKQEQKLKDPKERINMFQKDLTLISKALSK